MKNFENLLRERRGGERKKRENSFTEKRNLTMGERKEKNEKRGGGDSILGKKTGKKWQR